jgi:hypothetical protein
VEWEGRRVARTPLFEGIGARLGGIADECFEVITVYVCVMCDVCGVCYVRDVCDVCYVCDCDKGVKRGVIM